VSPKKLKTPCSHPLCPELTHDRFCEKHRKEHHREKDRDRASAAERGYDSRWRKVRKWYMRRNPLCERCLQEGTTKAAEVVHHITPIDDGGAKYDFDNLEALCEKCHRKHHGFGG